MDPSAEHARRRSREALQALTPEERITLAFALGEDDLRLFMEAHRLGRGEALARLRAARHLGRRPSVASQMDRVP